MSENGFVFGAHAQPSVRVTDDVAGVGGVLRKELEDFFVEELPAYEPAGEGEHIYLWVEKRKLSTMQMVAMIAKHFRVRRRDVGVAGFKDKWAVTRQLVSVHTPGKTPEDFPAFEHHLMNILWADLHTNKLKRGHLRGNRFVIRIRDVEFARVRDAHKALSMLARTGVPNRAGEQRFGHVANNHEVGRLLIAQQYDEAVAALLGPSADRPDVQRDARQAFARGDLDEANRCFGSGAISERAVLRELMKGRDAQRALKAIDARTMSFYLSAFQSAIFNAVLEARVWDGSFASLLEGDVAMKHGNLASFAVDADVLADPQTQQRLDAFEISPAGPMWGSDMMQASGRPGQMEAAALASAGVTPEQIGAFGDTFRFDAFGTRRPLRVPVGVPDVEGGVDEKGSYIKCSFELPRGAFATVVMDEIMKTDAMEVQEA